jgi:hypothetical protein
MKEKLGADVPGFAILRMRHPPNKDRTTAKKSKNIGRQRETPRPFGLVPWVQGNIFRFHVVRDRDDGVLPPLL